MLPNLAGMVNRVFNSLVRDKRREKAVNCAVQLLPRTIKPNCQHWENYFMIKKVVLDLIALPCHPCQQLCTTFLPILLGFATFSICQVGRSKIAIFKYEERARTAKCIDHAEYCRTRAAGPHVNRWVDCPVVCNPFAQKRRLVSQHVPFAKNGNLSGARVAIEVGPRFRHGVVTVSSSPRTSNVASAAAIDRSSCECVVMMY